MSRFRTVFWLGAAALLLAALGGFPLLQKIFGEDVDGPAQATDALTKSFDFGGSATLIFVDLNGSVSFTKAEREEERRQVTVYATKKARGADMNQAAAELKKVSLEFKQTKEGIEVRSTTGGGLFKQTAAGKRIDFRIVAPEGTGIRIAGGRGSVTLKGVTSDVDLQGPALSVDLNDIRGRVTARTDKGDIRVANAIGEARLETQDGSIVVSKLSGETLIAGATKDITITDGGAEEALRAVSTGGNVTLNRARGNTITIEAKGGKVSVADTTALKSLAAVAKTGSMSFNRVNASRFQALAESGDLDLTDVQGSLDLKAQRGKVTVWRATAKGLKISSSSDAVFFGELPDGGESSIQVATGSISLYVGKESAFKLDAKTGAGSITVDQMLQLDSQDKAGSSRIRGAANEGAALLNLSTGAGNIKISAGGPPSYFTPGGAR